MESTQLNTTTVRKEVVLDASSDRVWRALTDKDQMKEWYFTLTDFKPEVGFEFSFSGTGSKGDEYVHLCRVTQAIPGKLLQYTWTYKTYAGTSLVTFELTPEGNKTRLRLTHEGLESFAQNGPDFLASSFNQGWSALIEEGIGTYLKRTA
ncbi:SRPBCC domain-containing protein [Niabella sp. CC-SYL272]|uniref:SRPBCC family protein n=1 Tax=Niabella agricola TaxID=2891571 RepID=UPI001F1DCD6A|nr:SRPBCC domain-containing protein [Niabella agricola]MCF3108736.1 SRPBCC domain-containing protein [Niabella agricola]